ncbi:uncharacterized protein BO80DRAFT_70514 [Aspergillus ibericus CBS 121593]|uniref:Uncharacterized protein n=1 Tax=Aspergillus ibericus CBS 121593 TaxID=1448316 RepID=A0A395GZY7_9EURO|nr:hypothetical protein BO80DRAFT_70514 [Aspergillus ibericus CBS 121593]RAL01126.1 hypothetical protein BO80DRAFT_70514 [Aspergillus ibericus CBS 121593]
MPLARPRRHRRGLKTGGRWTEDERQHLWRLRSEHLSLSWAKFRQQFFAHRSLNALQKAYSIMSVERKRSDIVNAQTPKIQGRVVKRPLPDQREQKPRLAKQAKITKDIPFEGGLVEETDDSGSTNDEASGSGSDSDSDSGSKSEEETVQGPKANSQNSTKESDTSPGKEVAGSETRPEEVTIIQDTSKHDSSSTDTSTPKLPTGPIDKEKPSSKSTPEEKTNVVASHNNPTKDSNQDPLSLPPYMQMMESTLLQYKMTMWKNRDQERITGALQEEVNTLKKLNTGKEDKIARLQDEVRKHLQTIRSLVQAENRYKDEIDRQKSANQLLSSQNAVLEQKLVIARSDRKCETCERVSELISPSLSRAG